MEKPAHFCVEINIWGYGCCLLNRADRSLYQFCFACNGDLPGKLWMSRLPQPKHLVTPEKQLAVVTERKVANPALSVATAMVHGVKLARQLAVLTEQIVLKTGRSAWWGKDAYCTVSDCLPAFWRSRWAQNGNWNNMLQQQGTSSAHSRAHKLLSSGPRRDGLFHDLELDFG